MTNKFNDEQKQKIVGLYNKGQSVASLCIQYNVPRSTLYHWIQQYHPLKTVTDKTVYYHEYLDLKRHADKLETQLEVIKAAGCGTAAPLQEKLAALEKLYGQYSVHALCEALDVSRGTFYNHIFRRTDVTQNDKRREVMRELVREVFDESKQRFGAKKICAVLAGRGVKTSDKYVSGLMREMGLCSIGTNAKLEYKKRGRKEKKQDHLKQEFNVSEPNRVWVSDTTCFKVKDKYYYICIILDLFSRKVVGHGISPKHTTYLITSTFRRTYESRGCPQKLTFHSDQGIQYTSKTFTNLLCLNNIVQSFSRSGKPHDNAVSESFFSSMKKKELYRTDYRSERQFREGVEDYIQFYNTERPHGTLAFKTPDQFEELYGKREKKAG